VIPRFARRLLAVAILFALICAARAPAPAQTKPYVIYVILSLTGNAASLGADEAAGFRAYEKVVNRTGGLFGQPLRFEIYDDQSNAATAVSLLGPILATKPVIVFGSTLAGQTQAMAALVKDNGPVLYGSTPNFNPEKNGYAFSAGCSTVYYSSAALRFYRMRGMTRVGAVANTDASGQNNLLGLDAAMAGADGKTMTIVDTERFGLTDIGISSQAARLKAAKPDVIFGFPNGTEFGTALHGFADSGIDLPVYTSAANFTPILLERLKSVLPSELTSTAFSFVDRNRSASDPLRAPIEEFYAEMDVAHLQATVAHLFAWDPARIVVTQLRKLGPKATAAQLRDAILAQKHFPGIAGYYDFSSGDQHGLSQEALLVIKNDPKTPGKITVVSKPGGAPK
jgi:branched-chain amino acid transport system substrate-binding protein